LKSKSGKLAVVTGGSKGIGAGLVHEFASQGYDVVTYARNEALLSNLKDNIEQSYGVTVLTKKVDAASVREVQNFGDFVVGLGREVSVLINNAGYFLPGNTETEAEGTLRQMLAVNLESAYELTRKLLPSMKKAGRGDIFNICSVASLKAYPQGGSYGIAKTALMGFNRNLREETKAHGIRVTAVYPGATLTDSWAGSGLPDNRFMPVEDIAKAIWSCHTLSSRTVVEELILRPQLGDI